MGGSSCTLVLTDCSPAQIEIELRLLTAMMDGIVLQWLLDHETDIHVHVSAYVERAIAA